MRTIVRIHLPLHKAAPTGDPSPSTANAIVRLGSVGKQVPTMPNAAGALIDMPKPDIARITHKAMRFWMKGQCQKCRDKARGGLTGMFGQIRFVTILTAIPAMKSCLRPYRSASRPATRRPLEISVLETIWGQKSAIRDSNETERWEVNVRHLQSKQFQLTVTSSQYDTPLT